MGAFGSCLSVFVLLGRQEEEALLLDQECDARTLLQLKLASYIHNGGNRTTALATAEESAALGSCGCASNGQQQMEDFETILQVLLLGALLTVMGVTVLLVDDDGEEGGLQNIKSMPRRLLTGNLMQDLSDKVAVRRKPMADLFPGKLGCLIENVSYVLLFANTCVNLRRV